MSRQMKVALNLLTIASDPENAKAGDIYFNILSKNLRIYNGESWFELTPPSTDPAPFYRHTHTFDGDVHTIDIQNPINFRDYNENSSPELSLPQVIGVDGGTPNTNNSNANWENLTLFDAGNPDSLYWPDNNDTINDNGNASTVYSDIVDAGGA
jgi:hypothetical protein